MNQDTYAISSQFQTDKAGNTHADTYFYRRPFIKGRALITFVCCCCFFGEVTLRVRWIILPFSKNEILSEIELVSFQDFFVMYKSLSIRNPKEQMKDEDFVFKLSLMLFNVIVASKSNNNSAVVVVAFLCEFACSHIFFILWNHSPKSTQNASFEYQNKTKIKQNKQIAVNRQVFVACFSMFSS